MKKISVVGHKNPDTDCTLSAIIMAEYLNKKWYEATTYIQGKLNKETQYLLEKYNILEPEIQTSPNPEIEVCLVDHNEDSQAPDNIQELNVTWLIDHHKISFSTSEPLYIRTEPLCSTASILYKMFLESGFEISESIATMMLACMMSDSLLWKSPTTTDEDKAIASELQEIAGIDSLEDFAMPMFDAKSDVWDMTAEELLESDYKAYEVWKYKYGSWVIETTNPNSILKRSDELLSAISKLRGAKWLDFIMLSVVDILWEKNTTLVLDGWDSQILETIFSEKVQNNLIDLWNRVSRKKQIIPYITEYFTSL